MITYVKLGAKAGSFSDPVNGIDLANNDVVALTSKKARSPKTKKAIIGGHLVKTSKTEYDAFISSKPKAQEIVATGSVTSADMDKLMKRISALENKNQELANANGALELEIEKLQNPEEEEETGIESKEFNDMTKDELLAYYKENYDITDKQEKAFVKLDKPGRVKELEALEDN